MFLILEVKKFPISIGKIKNMIPLSTENYGNLVRQKM